MANLHGRSANFQHKISKYKDVFEKHGKRILLPAWYQAMEAALLGMPLKDVAKLVGYASTGAVSTAIGKATSVLEQYMSDTGDCGSTVAAVSSETININGVEYIPMSVHNAALVKMAAANTFDQKKEAGLSATVVRVSKTKLQHGEVIELVIKADDALFEELNPKSTINIKLQEAGQ